LGFYFSFGKKNQIISRKKFGIIVTLIVVFLVILSLPIISRSFETHTGRFIRYDEIVWIVNESINSESEVRNFFNSHLINFLESSLNITKEHYLSYPDNPEPILKHMNIKFDKHHKVWRISIPIISKGADWNIDFFFGYIKPASHMHFSMTKDTGMVRIEC